MSIVDSVKIQNRQDVRQVLDDVYEALQECENYLDSFLSGLGDERLGGVYDLIQVAVMDLQDLSSPIDSALLDFDRAGYKAEENNKRTVIESKNSKKEATAMLKIRRCKI